MNIYIDESGSFVSSLQHESWNVVAAIAVAETARSTLDEALSSLRKASGGIPLQEVKLHQVDEAILLTFLTKLDRKDILLFATATDAGLNTIQRIAQHQAAQVADIRRNIPRMQYEGGRIGLKNLADEIEGLSGQLYVQLVCQVSLIDEILRRAINYYAQRRPQTLGSFRWRIDQKNIDKPTFERAFEKIAPGLLQSSSIRNPFEAVRGFNYDFMNQFKFKDGKAPEYLQRDYGLPEMEGFDLGKILRSDMKFVDSKSNEGIQVADLIASSFRRLLRGKFQDNLSVANALGRLTLQNRSGEYPISLITFSETERLASSHVSVMLRRLVSHSKSMFD